MVLASLQADSKVLSSEEIVMLLEEISEVLMDIFIEIVGTWQRL